MCVNNKSYYCLVLENIKKADFKVFPKVFIDRLISQLLTNKIIQPLNAPDIIANLNPIIFSKTNNDKKAIGTMNDFIYMYKVYRTTDSWSYISLGDLNSKLNDTLTGAGRNQEKNYGRPIEDMWELINKYCR